ncbi:hypothetical protein ACFHW2_15260 [Actinomadura sp. LOL_016]|uniref:hypothetical protein n=1 Tax=unclassified Actinomadura TaxID=2626254 RepID=UPI003A8027A8
MNIGTVNVGTRSTGAANVEAVNVGTVDVDVGSDAGIGRQGVGAAEDVGVASDPKNIDGAAVRAVDVPNVPDAPDIPDVLRVDAPAESGERAPGRGRGRGANRRPSGHAGRVVVVRQPCHVIPPISDVRALRRRIGRWRRGAAGRVARSHTDTNRLLLTSGRRRDAPPSDLVNAGRCG